MFLYKDKKDVYRLNSPKEQVIRNDPLKGLTCVNGILLIQQKEYIEITTKTYTMR